MDSTVVYRVSSLESLQRTYEMWIQRYCKSNNCYCKTAAVSHTHTDVNKSQRKMLQSIKYANYLLFLFHFKILKDFVILRFVQLCNKIVHFAFFMSDVWFGIIFVFYNSKHIKMIPNTIQYEHFWKCLALKSHSGNFSPS